MGLFKICRVCLNETSENIELYDYYTREWKIEEIIEKYLCFQILSNNQLSNSICVSCWNMLKQFHEFSLKIQEAHEQWLKENKNCKKLENKVCLVNVKNEANKNYDCEQFIHISDSKNESIQLDNKTSSNLSNDNTKSSAISKNRKIDSDTKMISSQYQHPQKPTMTNRKKRKEIYNQNDQLICKFYKIECELCYQPADSLRSLFFHYKSLHGMRQGYIRCCERKWKGRHQIFKHVQKHLNSTFSCAVCKKNFDSDVGLKAHMYYHGQSANKKFECDICKKRFISKTHLATHIKKMHLQGNNYKCDQCNKEFVSEKRLKIHVLGVHDAAFAIICDVCGKILKSKYQCALHMASLHGNGSTERVQCSLCESWFNNQIGLKRHIRMIHQAIPTPCKTCGKILRNRNAMNQHMRYKHENRYQFACMLCDKIYKRRINLREHMTSHTGSTLYACSYCSKTFRSNANMYKHRKKEHPDEWKNERDNKCGIKRKMKEIQI